MNVFNRVLAILFFLGLVFVLALGLLEPSGTLAALGYGVRWLEGVARSQFYVYAAAGIGGLVVAIVLLLLEARRPRRLTVKVQHSGGSVIELTTDSVSRGLAYHVAQVPGVISVEPVVVSTGRAVRVELDLEIDAGADVPTKTEEIIQLAREVIEGKLGLRMAKVAVNVRQAAYTGEVATVAKADLPLDLPADGPPALAQ
jgi:uncharacterized alkaline shock family protein YloU